jgi:hypothetical protein
LGHFRKRSFATVYGFENSERFIRYPNFVIPSVKEILLQSFQKQVIVRSAKKADTKAPAKQPELKSFFLGK